MSREQLDRHLQQVKTLAAESVDQVKEKAFGSFLKIESAFDDRVSKALQRLKLAKQQDFTQLEARLDQAEARITDLEGILSELQQKKEKTKARPKSP